MTSKQTYHRKQPKAVWLLMLTGILLIFATLTVSANEQTATTSYDAVPYSQSATAEARGTMPLVSYGLKVMAAREEMVFTGLCGSEITMTAEDICRAMNLSELNYIKIVSLPDPEKGTLFAGTMGATEGQVITAGSLSKLSFVPVEKTKASDVSISLAVNGSAYEISCRFRHIPAINYTPTVSLAPEISLSVETFSNMKTIGTLSAYDPEGDEMTYEIIRYAGHGRVEMIDKHTGAYTYTPDSGYVGNDNFAYVVRDMYGNYSTSAVVSIRVASRPQNVHYADIDRHEAQASILRVTQAGIMNGTRVGADDYFKPTEAISRLEFLVTAMHAAGITAEDVKTLSAPSFADASDIPDAMAPYVSLAVRRGYVTGKDINGETCFCPNESISRAEAAVILSNIIGYAKQTTVTAFADADAMPAWSHKALNSLKSLGILMPTDGKADAKTVMSRGDTALWLDRTVRVMTGN